MEDITILISTTNNLNILFINPNIQSKTTLKFEKNTCNTESYYDLSTKKILMKISGGDRPEYICLKLPQDTIDILDNIHKEELLKIETFFDSLKLGACNLLINEDKTMVNTKELIDTCYNSYYCQLFVYFINTKFNQNLKDMKDVQSFLLDRIDYTSFPLKNIDEYGMNYIVPIKDIK